MKENLEIKKRFNLVKLFSNEKTIRLWCATEAKILGKKGVAIVMRATGVSRNTITKGIKELESGDITPENTRIRKKGGGRKSAVENNPEIEKMLLEMIEPTVRGEPESSLLWTTKSLRKLSDELKKQGFNASHTVVGNILKANKFSLQANRKTDEGSKNPDRNAQFNHIHNKVKDFQEKSNPIISVDTKKKELVGNFKNQGREWHSKNNSPKVNVYDFLNDAEGKAIPYGIYDINNNLGWVNVGMNKDTAEFAVQSIRNWWNKMGIKLYPESKELLITADGGGSNGSRVRLWKKELQDLANEIGMKISVCHFPPGTSKWNKIEHRLFSYITKNWRGKPLISYEVIVNLIASTKTKKGLKVKCELDKTEYEIGNKVTDKDFNKINMVRDDFHGEWNYSINPGCN